MNQRIGVLGLRESSYPYVKALANLDMLGAVYDPSSSSIKEAHTALPDSFKKAKIKNSLNDFLAADLAGVVLAMPAGWHEELTRRLVQGKRTILVEAPFLLKEIPPSFLNEQNPHRIQTSYPYLYHPGLSFYLNRPPARQMSVELSSTVVEGWKKKHGVLWDLGIQGLAVVQKIFDSLSMNIVPLTEVLKFTQDHVIVRFSSERMVINLDVAWNKEGQPLVLSGTTLMQNIDLATLECMKVFSDGGLAPIGFTNRVTCMALEIQKMGLSRKNAPREKIGITLLTAPPPTPLQKLRRYHLVLELKDSEKMGNQMTTFESLNDRTAKNELKKILTQYKLKNVSQTIRVVELSELRSLAVPEDFLKFF